MPGRKHLLLSAFAGLAASGATAITPAMAEPLEQFKWSNRPIVIFTPAADDLRMVEQRALFINEINGLKDRDIVVTAVVGSERAMSELGPQPAASAEEFRARFNVAEDDFAVVLVGKDGGEKFRAGVTVPAPLLFEIIDQMPMRQREMRDG
ncbi:MAG: DUF4174 domain-containing protein [Pseudomonadota bacterium]